MEYKVVVVSAMKGMSTNFQKAADELAELVNKQMPEGWEPVGGVAVGRTCATEEPHLLQALVKR